MVETWLRNNTRAMGLGLVPPVAATLVGLALAAGGWGRWESPWLGAIGALLAVLGGTAMLLVVWQMRRPRVGYEAGHLLVYLTAGEPYRVPLEIVECFLLGRGPSFLPGRRHENTETHTIVIRLDEDAEAWSHRDVKPALGSWCDGHITIRGTWCEPLSVERVRELNAQLGQATRALRAAGARS